MLFCSSLILWTSGMVRVSSWVKWTPALTSHSELQLSFRKEAMYYHGLQWWALVDILHASQTFLECLFKSSLPGSRSKLHSSRVFERSRATVPRELLHQFYWGRSHGDIWINSNYGDVHKVTIIRPFHALGTRLPYKWIAVRFNFQHWYQEDAYNIYASVSDMLYLTSTTLYLWLWAWWMCTFFHHPDVFSSDSQGFSSRNLKPSSSVSRHAGSWLGVL